MYAKKSSFNFIYVLNYMYLEMVNKRAWSIYVIIIISNKLFIINYASYLDITSDTAGCSRIFSC